MKRREALFAGVLLLVTAVAAAAVLVVVRGGEAAVTQETFLERVHAVCTEYGARLDAIPPPLDLSSPGAVYESLGAAIPILRTQADAVRALDAPDALRDELDEFFALTERSLHELQTAYEEAGERALFPMATALSRFEEIRDEAKTVARRIGFDC